MAAIAVIRKEVVKVFSKLRKNVMDCLAIENKVAHQSKLSFAAKNMRKFWGYTSESINCPEGTDDLKVWETLR